MRFLKQVVFYLGLLCGIASTGLSTATPNNTIDSPSLPIQVKLVDNAFQILDSHSLWYPNQTLLDNSDLTQTQALEYNDIAKMQEQWTDSGLDINSLVNISILDSPATQVDSERNSRDTDYCNCNDCDTCKKICLAFVWLPPVWVV